MKSVNRSRISARNPSHDQESTPVQIADGLHSTAIHILRRLRREDESTGLRAPGLSALSVVVFGGPLTLGELANAEQVRPPSMTRIVRQLEDSGLVRRENDDQDRRVVRVAATTRGRRVLEQGRDKRVAKLAATVATLGQNDRRTLGRAVDIIQRMLRQNS